LRTVAKVAPERSPLGKHWVPSLVAKSDDGIDAHRATSRNGSGQEDNNDGKGSRQTVDERVCGADVHQGGAQDTGKHDSDKRAGNESGGTDNHALAEDHAKNVSGLRSERHANADFVGAACYGVRHDAVKADGGKEDSGGCEDGQKISGDLV